MSKQPPSKLVETLVCLGDPADAKFLQRFFKTGPGEYGEGDKFLGIRTPVLRKIAREYAREATLLDLSELLGSEYHEVRMAALLTMTYQFSKANEAERSDLFDLYIAHSDRGINNWDLVDVTAPHIVGAYLSQRDRSILYRLAKGTLWQKRISIISTFHFIRKGEYVDTLNLAEELVNEEHDLLHKAVGWVLREVGKHDQQLLYTFLDRHAATMPRTALRYSLERTPQGKKQHYMKQILH